MALTITDITVITTRGENRRPNSGEVTFSDGKRYDWNLNHDESGVDFYTSRKRMVHNEMLRFNSAKREALVMLKLNSDDMPAVEVIQVSLLT